MDWLKICTDYFNAGFYDINSLKSFVIKEKITETQYQEITGIPYTS